MADQEGKTPKRQRRMAREPRADTGVIVTNIAPSAPRDPKPSKLDRVQDLLLREGGASIAEIMIQTDWQQHSVRGAMAGAFKKRGLIIISEKIDGTRRYHASKPV